MNGWHGQSAASDKGNKKKTALKFQHELIPGRMITEEVIFPKGHLSLLYIQNTFYFNRKSKIPLPGAKMWIFPIFFSKLALYLIERTFYVGNKR